MIEMKRTAYSLFCLTLLCFAVVDVWAQSSAHQKPQAHTAFPPTLYRSPSTFAELPIEVTVDLKRRGCRIPQQGDTAEKTNVIHGMFAKVGQLDWAVLCSVDGVSRILVYWNGSEQNPAEIAKFDDRIYLDLEKGAAGNSLFLRMITPASKKLILKHYHAYGGPAPPTLDHQGIDDAFIGKASVTWYFYDKKWMKLTGAD